MNQFKIATLIAILFCCSAIAQSNASIESLTAYNKWRNVNGRNFLNDDEKVYRQMIFLENYQKIKNHNSNSSHSYQIGLNQFSDMHDIEFVETILMRTQSVAPVADNSTAATNSTSHTNSSVASVMDWRTKGAVTSVKNQGGCGSCWTFASAAVMESFNFIKGNNLTNFSEQQLLDCATKANGYGGYGCHGGWPATCLSYASKVGLTTSAAYPYHGAQGACNVNGTDNGYKPVSWKKVPATQTGMQTALNASPVSVIVDATKWGSYHSGVFTNCNTTITLNHAVLAVGYDVNGNWIVKNSWGTGWGSQGYITLAAGNSCGVLEDGYQITA